MYIYIYIYILCIHSAAQTGLEVHAAHAAGSLLDTGGARRKTNTLNPKPQALKENERPEPRTLNPKP